MKIKIGFLTLCLIVSCAWSGMSAFAASKDEIDARVSDALTKFYEKGSGIKKLADKASGMLVFPKVYKAGFGIGGEFGEGALLADGKTVDYYNIAAASIGFQFGGQVKTEVVLFMNEDVVSHFRNSDGWEAGVDGSVALITIGVGGEIDTNNITDPIIGFIFSNKGLMYNLTLEGSKITKIKK